MENRIHLPGLNGLRAIAALSVMWGHVFQSDFGNWGIEGFQLPVVADGVTLFFVISGFLITYLLLNEQQRSTTISIPKFYMRRILRIWPIYYVYMFLALSVTSSWGDSNVWYYGFFAANIPFVLAAGIIPIVHYWSLGVEEQFYLFWPWIAKATKGNTHRLLMIAISLCCGWLACKWGLYLFIGKGIVYRFFAVTRFDCMMIGAIGAILYFRRNKLLMQFTYCRWVGAVCLLLIAFSTPWAGYIPATVRPQVIALLSLAALLSQLGEKPIINLENKLFDSIGKISYGIYVIHPLLIMLLSGLYCSWGLPLTGIGNAIAIYLVITIATYFVAWTSYLFIENPFLRMKDRFSVVLSRNTIQ